MNKKLKLRLRKLEQHYANMHELLLSMLDDNDGGHWSANDEKVLFSNATEGTSICQEPDGTLYLELSSLPELKEAITDQRIIDLINEIRPKQKKVAKKKAQPKKNYKNATYMDVFKRVADHLDGTRYALYVGGDEEWEDCSEDDEVAMKVCDEEEDREGEQWLNWDSVKDFLTKPLSGNHCSTNTDGCANIFESVAFWESHRYKVKLGSPYLIWLIDEFGELGKVNIKKCDTPEKLMKALDKAGL